MLLRKKIWLFPHFIKIFHTQKTSISAYYEPGTGEEWRSGLKVYAFTLLQSPLY